jgi:16S rRNA (cytosine1402-N4)-methyltransferase
MAVISFHSLEDKRVARKFRKLGQAQAGASRLPITGELSGAGKHLTQKAIVATQCECETNPRARSALMRIFEKGDSEG